MLFDLVENKAWFDDLLDNMKVDSSLVVEHFLPNVRITKWNGWYRITTSELEGKEFAQASYVSDWLLVNGYKSFYLKFDQ